MRRIPLPNYLRSASLLLLLAIALLAETGCAITVQRPTNNALVPLPTTSVVIGANASFTNLKVTIDGNDVSGQMTSTSPSSAAGAFGLSVGSHTLTASATVTCWYCPGGTTESRDTKSFVVVSGNTSVCARGPGVPVISIDPALARVGQRPGRVFIGYQLQNGEGILIIVDDAPGLLRTQMLVEVDIDPAKGVSKSKMIEAWSFCQGNRAGFVTSGLAGEFNTGFVCNPLSAGNNFRSGCTTPNPPMLIDQSTTSELWLRKQGTFGNWDYKEAIDQSMWPVFGGRLVRFIWFKD